MNSPCTSVAELQQISTHKLFCLYCSIDYFEVTHYFICKYLFSFSLKG